VFFQLLVVLGCCVLRAVREVFYPLLSVLRTVPVQTHSLFSNVFERFRFPSTLTFSFLRRWHLFLSPGATVIVIVAPPWIVVLSKGHFCSLTGHFRPTHPPPRLSPKSRPLPCFPTSISTSRWSLFVNFCSHLLRFFLMFPSVVSPRPERWSPPERAL